MPRYDVACPNGHEAERWATVDDRAIACAVCGAPTSRVWRARPSSITRDEIPGGQVIETLQHDPITVYSQSELRKEADKRGLRLRDCWAGEQDKHLTNWAAGASARQLENARILVERASQPQRAPATVETFQAEWRKPSL